MTEVRHKFQESKCNYQYTGTDNIKRTWKKNKACTLIRTEMAMQKVCRRSNAPGI